MAFSFRTKINAGFLPAFAFLIVISVFAYRNTRLLVDNEISVARTEEVRAAIEEVLSEAKDLETGQRGFLITGTDDYLEPYRSALGAIDPALDRLQQLTAGHESQQLRVRQLRDLKDKKLAELNQGIRLRREKGFDAAFRLISTNSGKDTMDAMRAVASDMRNEETRVLDLRNEKVAESTRITIWVIVVGGFLSILILFGAAIVVNLAESERVLSGKKLESQNRIRAGLVQLSERMAGELSVAALAKNIIETVANFVRAQVGAVYLADDAGTLRWAGGFAFQKEEAIRTEFKPGEGLVGQAALQKGPISVVDAPKDYVKVSSSLGDASPKCIYVVPFTHEGKVKGVTELGAFSPFSEADLEYVKLGLESIAISLNSAQVRAKVAELLEETQAQSEELQVQQEELKAANEELQSKTQELEAQQEELKQTNEELEEQRSTLEEQAERLEEKNREVQKSRQLIEDKATELERASKYKSEFLANMSHELRTPLNSILLLSKSLSENVEGNLTLEQEEICRTVHSSGVDLLSLINDILDLSKVEAGKLDVRGAEAEVADLAKAMENLFRKQMEQKGLAFGVEVSKSCPKTIFTDRLRLEQILKNFLSNALKFTQSGKVTLSFERPAKAVNLSASGLAAESSIAISVTDTGIGIPEDKKAKIFEAFEQVDSASSRKFGGAGLGLTIATKLSQLLGGEIQVESSQGKGSRFVIFLPERLSLHAAAEAGPVAVVMPEAPAMGPVVVRMGAHGIEDDRNALTGKEKVILIIEDDPRFAKVLHAYCHDRGFKCLLASDGESGLSDAFAFLPSAILLDLRLPGMNGMTVLENLKGSAKTQNIPVHVMSVDEKESDVLKLGAIGFLSKPATREGIESAIRKIEEKLLTKASKVLVVEDRQPERENILRLISGANIESTAAGSAADAVKRLKTEAFDCVILDLKLPDMSGIELLEQIEKAETLSRPPVIVYTDRDLTKDELERARKSSQSIIIKGARSEERLLDEVTLFLHRVESELPKEKRKGPERVRHREEIFEGKKLLVVDDDMRNVFALRSIFSKKGFEILVAKTGKEALDKLQANPDVDLVLMDIMMPEMDGYEAIRRIRSDEKNRKLPIIALTAKAMPADRERCLEAGANDYLPKPIDMDHLLSLLRVWLAR